MRRSLALWMICLSLIAARVMGLHLHVCTGLESGVPHAGSHLADNGLLFGEHHAEDDGDDQEVDLAVAIAQTQVHLDFDDLSAPLPAAPRMISMAEQLLSLLAPRGPPLAAPAHPPYFTPPLRGPPAHSLA